MSTDTVFSSLAVSRVFVCGDELLGIRMRMKDEAGNPISLAGATVELQANSPVVVPSVGVPGVILDGPNGYVQFKGIGAHLASSDLLTDSADFVGRARATLASGDVTFSEPVEFTIVRNPNGESAGMTTEEFAAMYKAEQRRWVHYRFPFSSVPQFIQRNNPPGAFSLICEGPALRVNQAAPGANKIIEVNVYGTQTDAPFELRDQGPGLGGSILDFPRRLHCYVGAFGVNGTPSDTMWTGIEMGSFFSNVPFAAAPVGAAAQLRVRMSDRKIEFATAIGDGVAPIIVDLINLGEISPHGVYMELEHFPDLTTGQDLGTINAYIDGVLVASRSGANMPQFGASGAGDCGIIVTSGANANAQWSSGASAFFSDFGLAVRYRDN